MSRSLCALAGTRRCDCRYIQKECADRTGPLAVYRRIRSFRQGEAHSGLCSTCHLQSKELARNYRRLHIHQNEFLSENPNREAAHISDCLGSIDETLWSSVIIRIPGGPGSRNLA